MSANYMAPFRDGLLVLLGHKNVQSPVAGILKAWGRRLEQVSR
jgi:hypothetical protein